MGSGLLAPPFEIQSLVEALRFHVEKFKDQSSELVRRSDRIQETERAMGTLFSGLQYLVRHNEALLEELIKKEKLASMSEMAAQLAHEIRNPLNSLNLKLELLREELEPIHQEQLDKVLGEIDRLDALTESHLRTTRTRLQQGSRNSELQDALKPSKLLHLVTESIETLRPEIEAAGIEIEFSFTADAPSPEVLIPGNVVKASLVNLLKNSKEALDDSATNPRRIRIDLKSENASWALWVSDTGCGFPQDFLGSPIESFRTTKSSGSGLGLSTTEQMLKAFDVEVQIESPSRSLDGFATTVKLSPRLALDLDSKKDESAPTNSGESLV